MITPTPVKEAALKHNLLVLQPEKISGSPEMEKVIDLAPDLIVTAAFGQFLPEQILKAPKLGAIKNGCWRDFSATCNSDYETR